MAIIKTGLNPWWPACFCRAPSGEVYVTNGLDRPQRWNGQTSTTQNAGIEAPNTKCTVAARSTSGSNYGSYNHYVRFVDVDGHPSNLSALTSTLITSGDACDGFKYSAIPTTTDTRVTAREIWSNTDGQEVSVYLRTTIDDNSTTTGLDLKTDGDLKQNSASQILRLYTADGFPNANRFGPPPYHMSVAESYYNRMWYAVPVDYTEGGISEASTTTVRASGLQLNNTMIGRRFYVGGRLAGTVLAVPSSTSFTLSTSQAAGFGGALDYYAISPPEDERRRIYFSEAGEPESFPRDDDGNHTNVLDLQDTDDVLTGLMAYGGNLWALATQSIFRVSTAGDPRKDGYAVPIAGRGCVNNRCWVLVEAVAFLMDRQGIYAFDGNATQPLSDPIQDYFRGPIRWGSQKWFHAVHDPTEQVIRWFVSLDGSTYPMHALCFHYRSKQFWTENYRFQMGASCQATIAGETRTIAGAGQQVMLMNEGVLDGPAPYASHRSERLDSWADGTVSGTATGATIQSLSDSSATYVFTSWLSNAGVIGAPITVVDADGTQPDQTRRVVSIDGTTIRVDHPWDWQPASGDSYHIAGIPWRIKLGTFRFPEESLENKRRIAIWHKPLSESGTLNVRRYVNQGSTPVTYTQDWDNQEGVTFSSDSANAVVDLSRDAGYAELKLDDGFERHSVAHRMVDVELTGISGQEKMEIHGIDLEGVE